jgi:hypothetical protein
MTTYTKLRDGSWGIKVQGTASAGQTVTVTKRDGSSKAETVARVLWAGDGVAICSVANKGASSGRSGYSGRRSGGRYECEECGDMVSPGTQCWETGCTH